MISNRCSEAAVCLLEGLTLIGSILKLCVSRLSLSDRLYTVACSPAFWFYQWRLLVLSLVRHLMLYQSKLKRCTFKIVVMLKNENFQNYSCLVWTVRLFMKLHDCSQKKSR